MIVPTIDASKLTLTILSYIQHLSTIAKAAQKTLDENTWSLVAAQTKLKARMEEILTSRNNWARIL